MNYITRIFLSLVVLLLLVSCKADRPNLLEGNWNAQDSSGSNLIIAFTSDTVTVDGQEYDYREEKSGSVKGIEYVLMEQNGEKYTIIFPDEDNTLAFLIQPDSEEDLFKGTILYALDKNEKPDYKKYVHEYFE